MKTKKIILMITVLILVTVISITMTSNSNIAISYTTPKLVQAGLCANPAVCESIMEHASNTEQQQQIASSHALPNSLTTTMVYHGNSLEGLESSPVTLSSSITSTVKRPDKGTNTSNTDLAQLGDDSRSGSRSNFNNPNPSANTYTAKVNTRMGTGTAQLLTMTNKHSLVQQNSIAPTVLTPLGSLSLVHPIACRNHTVWQNGKPIDCILELPTCTPLSQYHKCSERRTSDTD